MPKPKPNQTADGQLACAFGEPWDGPHPLCDAEADRLEAVFADGVAAGRWDADGYTSAERRAQARHRREERT